MKLITVYTTLNAADAELIRSRLEASNFHVAVMGELSALSIGYTQTAGGIRVQVPDDEAEDARALLASAHGPGTD
jgi:flagellar biosynthesis/type III secretory pathway M-ring protein FliF/YscJ